MINVMGQFNDIRYGGIAFVYKNQGLLLMYRCAADLVALRFDIQLQPEVRFIGKYGEVDSQQTIS